MLFPIRGLGRKKAELPDFGRIYDQYFQKIFHYALGRTGSVADAEDLTAQTFFKALKHYHRVREDGPPLEAWLYRIAGNEINQLFRKRKRAPYRPATPEAAEAVATECASAEQHLARRELFQNLGACLRTLKPEDQNLLALRYLEGLPFAQIAAILEIREGTAAMRTKRALEKLKPALAERGFNHERVRETFGDQPSDYRGADLPAHPAP